MKFKTVSEAYNFYRSTAIPVLEARAAAIKDDVATNKDADIASYNVELEGIMRVKEEQEQQEKEDEGEKRSKVILTGKDGSKDVEPAASREYRSAFYKHLQGKQLTNEEQNAYNMVNVEQRANEFNKLSNSAAVIPTTTLNEVIVKARKEGGILGISRGFNMPSNIAVPVATPGAAASWHVEGAVVETEKVAPTSVTFSANEIMRILSISAAVDTMSISAFESYLSDELTASVMACLAGTMINGNGTGQGVGIVSGITWTEGTNKLTVAVNADLTYKNIVKAISMLKRGYSNGAKFVMNNNTLYNSIYGLVDDVKRPVFVADPTESGKGRILGFEVVIDDFMEDNDFLFGNFWYNGYNMPAGIALDVSHESSFKSGLVDYRALAIADCKPIVDEAFVYGTKATE